MSFTAARNALDMAKVAITGLEILEQITHVGGDKAAASLAAARAAIDALKEGFEGKTDPQVVLAQLESLQERLKANDAAADQALRDKFKTPASPK